MFYSILPYWIQFILPPSSIASIFSFNVGILFLIASLNQSKRNLHPPFSVLGSVVSSTAINVTLCSWVELASSFSSCTTCLRVILPSDYPIRRILLCAILFNSFPKASSLLPFSSQNHATSSSPGCDHIFPSGR